MCEKHVLKLCAVQPPPKSHYLKMILVKLYRLLVAVELRPPGLEAKHLKGYKPNSLLCVNTHFNSHLLALAVFEPSMVRIDKSPS